MSSSNISSGTYSNKDVIAKAIIQGKRLRNNMVKFILNNDPYNTDVFRVQHPNTPVCSSAQSTSEIDRKLEDLHPREQDIIHTYLKGDFMPRKDEQFAMELLKSMSTEDFCKTTEKVYCVQHKRCACSTCKAYNEGDLSCDIKRSSHKLGHTINKNEQVTENLRSGSDKSAIKDVIKYVDCIRINVQSLSLNETGVRKASSSNKNLLTSILGTVFFVEYQVPNFLAKKYKSASKVDCGLNTDHVRICARKIDTGDVYFRHIAVHDVCSLWSHNLEDIEFKFVISCRTPKQKYINVLGHACLNLASVHISRYLSCTKEVEIRLAEDKPIIVGLLKVSLQFGCGRLYFGKEFVDAVTTNKENNIVLYSDEASISDSEKLLQKTKQNSKESSQCEGVFNQNLLAEERVGKSVHEKPQPPITEAAKEESPKLYSKLNKTVHSNKGDATVVKKNVKQQGPRFKTKPVSRKVSSSTNNKVSLEEKTSEDKEHDLLNRGDILHPDEALKLQISSDKSSKAVEIQTDDPWIQSRVPPHRRITENEKQLLFGFLYISEAQFLRKPLNSYLVCRLFSQTDSSVSRLIDNTSNPAFNFSQTVPLVYEDDLLEVLRDGCMVIEVLEKLNTRDLLIGITKLPLNQFYIAYKNPVIVKYLVKNKLPIVGCDWWEPILNPITEEIVGQIQVLTAIGTAEQIDYFECQRGFKKNIVKPISTYQSNHHIQPFYNQFDNHQIFSNNQSFVEESEKKKPIYSDNVTLKNIYTSNKDLTSDPTKDTHIQKSDIAVQSDPVAMENQTDENKVSQTQEMLGAFLNQLMAQKQKNIHVENSTNTENINLPADTDNSVAEAQNATNVQLRKTSDLLESLQKALSVDSTKVNTKKSEPELSRSNTFRVCVKVENALHLPSRKKCKSRKSRGKSGKAEDILPSTYVTFQTGPGEKLVVTKIIPKSTSPVWNYENEFSLPLDYLSNNHKRLIFKVWRKSTNTVMQPNMETDVVVGFAAVDLAVLTTGLSDIKGWFNIVDFSGKINGQIKVCITPQENLTKYQNLKEHSTWDNTSPKTVAEHLTLKTEEQNTVTENFEDLSEETGELLSRALKRKFTELDEITQRLRLRLSKVTNDDSDVSNDDLTDQFEIDINTLCVEDDFDMVDFEDEARKLNLPNETGLLCTNMDNKEDGQSSETSASSKDLNSLNLPSDEKQKTELSILIPNSDERSSETSLITCQSVSSDPANYDMAVLDKNLAVEKERIDALLGKLSALQSAQMQPKVNKIEKQQIDNLLEKLSIASGDVSTFSNRYVSGCSASHDDSSAIDTEALLKALDHDSRPNIHSASNYDPRVFQQIFTAEGNNRSLEVSTDRSGSDTSIFTNPSSVRVAPDGQGTSADD